MSVFVDTHRRAYGYTDMAKDCVVFGQLGFFRHQDGRVSMRLLNTDNKPNRYTKR